MIKISELDAKDTAPLHLKDAAGEPMFFKGKDGEEQKVRIFVYGPGSEPFRQAQLRANRRVMAIMKRGRRALEERSVEERAKDTADLLADITASVEGLDLEGASLRDGMHRLYANPRCGYVADQVNAFAAEWGNFTESAQTA